MRALIIGASKGIGLETTRQALDAGHHVRSLARSAAAIAISNPNLEKIRGDALKTEDVAAALVGVDVVIQTLALQLPFCFEVRAPSDRLVSSAPERPCDDVGGLDPFSSEPDSDAPNFLD